MPGPVLMPVSCTTKRIRTACQIPLESLSMDVSFLTQQELQNVLMRDRISLLEQAITLQPEASERDHGQQQLAPQSSLPAWRIRGNQRNP